MKRHSGPVQHLAGQKRKRDVSAEPDSGHHIGADNALIPTLSRAPKRFRGNDVISTVTGERSLVTQARPTTSRARRATRNEHRHTSKGSTPMTMDERLKSALEATNVTSDYRFTHPFTFSLMAGIYDKVQYEDPAQVTGDSAVSHSPAHSSGDSSSAISVSNVPMDDLCDDQQLESGTTNEMTVDVSPVPANFLAVLKARLVPEQTTMDFNSEENRTGVHFENDTVDSGSGTNSPRSVSCNSINGSAVGVEDISNHDVSTSSVPCAPSDSNAAVTDFYSTSHFSNQEGVHAIVPESEFAAVPSVGVSNMPAVVVEDVPAVSISDLAGATVQSLDLENDDEEFSSPHPTPLWNGGVSMRSSSDSESTDQHPDSDVDLDELLAELASGQCKPHPIAEVSGSINASGVAVDAEDSYVGNVNPDDADRSFEFGDAVADIEEPVISVGDRVVNQSARVDVENVGPDVVSGSEVGASRDGLNHNFEDSTCARQAFGNVSVTLQPPASVGFEQVKMDVDSDVTLGVDVVDFDWQSHHVKKTVTGQVPTNFVPGPRARISRSHGTVQHTMKTVPDRVLDDAPHYRVSRGRVSQFQATNNVGLDLDLDIDTTNSDCRSDFIREATTRQHAFAGKARPRPPVANGRISNSEAAMSGIEDNHVPDWKPSAAVHVQSIHEKPSFLDPSNSSYANFYQSDLEVSEEEDIAPRKPHHIHRDGKLLSRNTQKKCSSNVKQRRATKSYYSQEESEGEHFSFSSDAESTHANSRDTRRSRPDPATKSDKPQSIGLGSKAGERGEWESSKKPMNGSGAVRVEEEDREAITEEIELLLEEFDEESLLYQHFRRLLDSDVSGISPILVLFLTKVVDRIENSYTYHDKHAVGITIT
ncbi:hypothetical protein K435DRAFT_853514 [Dendrothele bispora CBS 962.96]|uniref:Uncharacterized protein n=1 Tax=Dendrothele bispora (strain CBS 962.96) TaxID=1314807 RepID=A0A4S8MG77_DENBC|nr:hypothetical protein K435DRAFT_853514 [Dendrothele bispora CBS 962.96]